MSNLITNTLDNAFRWVCCGKKRKPRRCNNCDPCSCIPDLTIKYSWGGGMRDLDTGTTFLGETAGWSCSSSGSTEYMRWSGDDTSADGTETITVCVGAAQEDGAWTSSVVIDCAAGWYIPAGGSGPADLSVTYRGETRTMTVSPGSQSDCATTSVASITINDDGTWELS